MKQNDNVDNNNNNNNNRNEGYGRGRIGDGIGGGENSGNGNRKTTAVFPPPQEKAVGVLRKGVATKKKKGIIHGTSK